MRKNIVFATCRSMPAVQTDDALIAQVLEARGCTVTPAPWNGPFEPFAVADMVVVRSTWDYFEESNAFAKWLRALESVRGEVVNSSRLIDQHYVYNDGKGLPFNIVLREVHHDDVLVEDADDPRGEGSAFIKRDLWERFASRVVGDAELVRAVEKRLGQINTGGGKGKGKGNRGGLGARTVFETYDEAFVEAVDMANRLGRKVELRRAGAFIPQRVRPIPGEVFGPIPGSEWQINLIGPHDAIKGQIVNPGEPLTARQMALRDGAGGKGEANRGGRGAQADLGAYGPGLRYLVARGRGGRGLGDGEQTAVASRWRPHPKPSTVSGRDAGPPEAGRGLLQNQSRSQRRRGTYTSRPKRWPS